jgi:pyroglutamyl-peptidase
VPSARKRLRILVTGFGPFPDAPKNPSGPLVRALARKRRPRADRVTIRAYVLPTRYQAVDRTLPRLLKAFRPDAILMFGLATRSRALRVETLARNRISRHPDAAGFTPGPCAIDAASRRSLKVRAPAAALLRALKRTGLPARLSRNAGDYLCNYALWQATRATAESGGPKLSAFIHVPPLSLRITPELLLEAVEAVLKATIATLRRRRPTG